MTSKTDFWENLSYDLLEMNLNNEAMNKRILQDLFKERPDVLAGIDFGEGLGIDDLDKKMYSGKADVIEVKEAKSHELWECIPCGKTFRRKDNLQRHLRSSLHARRLARFEACKRRDDAKATTATEQEEVKREECLEI